MSDSNMSRRGGIVIGTAGHIDHGKTSLVRALTGIDTDRLAEEKRRGISIDLGFAHLDLPGGKSISFVDVPGHERFIRNMLAGAAGIEAVLLVIAADECVKPQTREHFDICRLLGIAHGLIALTKCDLVSESQLVAAEAAVRELVAGSFLDAAPVIPVSAVTRAGLERLTAALWNLAAQNSGHAQNGFARLPIDRSFALKGFGTVLTGTLTGGPLRLGDTVQIYPAVKSARIRGLQVHGAPVEIAYAGERTAVNLSGIDHAKLRRGFTLTATTALQPSYKLQASLDLLAAGEIDGGEELLFHIGTAELPARIRTLSALPRFIEVHLNEPVLAIPGDRFVLRRPSPSQTIGGGVILETFPPRRLNRVKAAARLARMADADLPARIAILIEETENGRSVDDLVRLTGQPAANIQTALAQAPELILVNAARRILSRRWLEFTRRRILNALTEYHKTHPAEEGAPLSLVRLGLENALMTFALDNCPEVRITGDKIALASFRPQLTSQEAAELARIERQFRAAAYQPPSAAEFPRDSLERLIKAGKLVRISNELVFHADVIAHIRSALAKHKGRRFSVPEFKQWTQISRKYAIPLLEFLDHQHITRREGDMRIVL